MIDNFQFWQRQALNFHLAALKAIFIKTQATNFVTAERIRSTLFKFYNNQSLGGVRTKFDNHPFKIIPVIYFFLF